MKILRKTISALLSLSISAAAIAVPVISASAEETVQSGDVMVLANGNDSTKPPLPEDNLTGGYDSENARIYEQTWKLQPGSKTNQSYGTKSSGVGDQTSINLNTDNYKDYKYINYWIYSSEDLSKSGTVSASTLSLLLRRQAANTDMCYYTLPVNWQGWKLVTLEIKKDFSIRGSKSWDSFADFVGWNMVANPTSKAHSAEVYNPSVTWNSNPDAYVCYDYVYLSKEIPSQAEALKVAASDVPQSNVMEIKMNRQLNANAVHNDKISVSKAGENVNINSISVAGDTLKLELADAFEADKAYTVALSEGAVYDEYGFTGAYDVTITNEAKLVSSAPALNGVVQAPEGKGKVSLSFNTELAAESEISISPEADYTLNVEGKNLNINLNDAKANTRYTVDLSKVIGKNGFVAAENAAFVFNTGMGVDEILEFSSTGYADADISNPTPANMDETTGSEYGATSITDNARMFDSTLKYSAMSYKNQEGKNYGQAYAYGVTKNTYVNENGYINLWVYSDTIADRPDDDYIPTIGIYLSNNEKSNKAAENYLKYKLVVDWNTGWKLVSIPISGMTNESFDISKPIKSFKISSNYGDDGVKWSGVLGSVLFDYIYYTEAEPSAELTAAAPVYTEEVANNTQTISFDFNRNLKANTVHNDCVSVSVNGEALTSGYSAAVNGNDASKLDVIFDKPLELGANYQISVMPGAVYDVYGNAAAAEYNTQFTVNSDFDITEKSVSDVAVSASGEGEVSVVFNGDISTDITKDSISITPSLDYDVTVLENKLNISFTNAKANTEYTVNVGNVSYKNNENLKPATDTFTFTTGSGAYVIYKAEDGITNKVSAAQSGTGSYGYGLNINEVAKASMVTDNTRSFDKTLLYTIPDGAWANGKTYGQNFLEFRDEFSLNDGYDYVNIWVYSDALPKDSSGNTSTVWVYLSQNDMDALDSTGYAYSLPIDWSNGWRLVSIPVSDFITLDKADSDKPIKAVTLAVNYSGPNSLGKRWSEGGALKLDYIYLSKGAPANTTLSADSEEINGNTVAFTANRPLISTVNRDNVSVKADGAEISNYSLAVDTTDNTKLILTLDNVMPDTTYSVDINSGAVHDIYGNEVIFNRTFMSQKSDFAVKTPEITVDGTNASVSAKVVVNDGKTYNVTLIAAQYDENDALIGTKVKTCAVSETDIVDLNGIDIMPETTELKVMVWNMEYLEPYTDVVPYIVK